MEKVLTETTGEKEWRDGNVGEDDTHKIIPPGNKKYEGGKPGNIIGRRGTRTPSSKRVISISKENHAFNSKPKTGRGMERKGNL